MTVPPPNVCQLAFALHTLLGQPDWKEETRTQLLQLLTQHGLSWNDLATVLAEVNTSFAAMPLPELLTQHGLAWADMSTVFAAINTTAGKTPRKFAALRQLHQPWGQFGNANAHTAATARKKFDARLIKYKLGWTTWTTILIASVPPPAAATPPPPSPDPRDVDPAGPIITPLDLTRALLQDYLALDQHEYVAMALWAVHTHVHDRFEHTPRLALTSPVKGCGKSTALNVLSRLVARPELVDNITAGALYDTIDRDRPTMLIDEADNLELSAKAALRAILNAGYLKNRYIRRGVGRQARRYAVFAPIALASIGTLTLPLMSRSIVLHMTKHDGSRRLRRFVEGDTQDLDIAYSHTRAWARDVALNSDPEMPSELRDRAADNWRPLLAIADACSRAWGTLAREAAIAFARRYHDEDIIVVLLAAIRDVFDASEADRLKLEDIVTALHAIEDAGWDEWRGEKGGERPHKITKAEISPILKERFRVKTRSIWPPPPRRPEHKSGKGYYRADLEPLWAAYCRGAGTAARPGAVPQLRVIDGTSEG